MSQDIRVIAAICDDPTRLPPIDSPAPAITDKHLKLSCSRCRLPCWIGPRQFQRWRSTAWPVWCYRCLYDEISSGRSEAGEIFDA